MTAGSAQPNPYPSDADDPYYDLEPLPSEADYPISYPTSDLADSTKRNESTTRLIESSSLYDLDTRLEELLAAGFSLVADLLLEMKK